MPSNASSAGVKEDKAWAYNNRMYFGIDYGYYPAASFGGMSNVSERYITYSSLARDIGLTAPKILKGNTILGIAGTADGKTNHTDTYILAASETTKDLTADHPYRYIDATNVYNKGKSDGEANKAQNLNVTYIWNDRNVDENDGIDKSYTFPYSGTVRIDWRLYYCRYYGGYDPYVDLRGTRLGTTSGSGTYTVNAGDVIHAYQHPALVGDPDSDGFLSVLYMY